MSGLIDRIQDRTASADERMRVLDVDEEETDVVIDALASGTRRAVFRSLFDTPGTPSELAARVDTSVQNVHYHLESLQDAGLVEPLDTRYSEKGYEMTVYGPASDPIVLVGNRELRPRIRQSLTEVVGGLSLLAIASLLVQWGFERLVAPGAYGVSVAEPASTTATPALAPDSFARTLLALFEPGVLFFLGCLLVVAYGAYSLTESGDGR